MPTTTRPWPLRTLSWVYAALCSVVRTPQRLLFVAWTVAIYTVGTAQLAYADTDVLGNTTDDTQFWGIPLSNFTLPPLNLSDAHHGAPYIEEAMWGIFHAIGNVLLFLMMAFIRGAITAMQWMLNLTIYQDAAGPIDTAVKALAVSLFWPLLAATVAWAAATVFTKYVAGGQVVSEILWVVVAGVIAVGFMQAPSKTAGDLDQIRTVVSSAAAEGYSHAAGGPESSAGLPTPNYPADRTGAVNQLGDAMWNVYAVTPWCLASFGPDLSVCKDVGHELLRDTDRWKAIDASTHERGENDDESPPCADELKGHCDIVRGQDYGRLGVILFLTVIGLALGVLLLILVIYGVLALVEFLVLLMLAPLFLVGCMIPGRPRAIGVRWGEGIFATLLTTVVLTGLIGVVMVLADIFNQLLPTWGMFKVALLNVAVFIAAFRVRGQFENITGMKSGTSGFGNSYLTMKALTSLSKATAGLSKMGVKGTAHGGVAAGHGAKAAFNAGMNQIDNPKSASHRAAGYAGHQLNRVRTYASQAAQDRLGTPPQPLTTASFPASSSSGTGSSSAGSSAPAAPAASTTTAPPPRATSSSTAPPGGKPGARPAAASTGRGGAGRAHQWGGAGGQSPTPNRRATVQGGVYTASSNARPKGTPMSTPQQPKPASRPISSTQAPAYSTRRPAEVRSGRLPTDPNQGTLPDGRKWIPKPPKVDA